MPEATVPDLERPTEFNVPVDVVAASISSVRKARGQTPAFHEGHFP
jgi:hypothetical protein